VGVLYHYFDCIVILNLREDKLCEAVVLQQAR